MSYLTASCVLVLHELFFDLVCCISCFEQSSVSQFTGFSAKNVCVMMKNNAECRLQSVCPHPPSVLDQSPHFFLVLTAALA